MRGCGLRPVRGGWPSARGGQLRPACRSAGDVGSEATGPNTAGLFIGQVSSPRTRRILRVAMKAIKYITIAYGAVLATQDTPLTLVVKAATPPLRSVALVRMHECLGVRTLIVWTSPSTLHSPRSSRPFRSGRPGATSRSYGRGLELSAVHPHLHRARPDDGRSQVGTVCRGNLRAVSAHSMARATAIVAARGR
jgi:hypothetical protein